MADDAVRRKLLSHPARQPSCGPEQNRFWQKLFLSLRSFRRPIKKSGAIAHQRGRLEIRRTELLVSNKTMFCKLVALREQATIATKNSIGTAI